MEYDTITMHRDPFTIECFRERSLDSHDSKNGNIEVDIWPDGRIDIVSGFDKAFTEHNKGLPFEAKVIHRDDRWLDRKARDNPLYSYHPHPDLGGSRAIRTDPKRFLVAYNELRKLGVIGRFLMVGCCSGLGPATIAGLGMEVVAIEYVEERAWLATMWARAARLPFTCVNAQFDDYEIPSDIEAVIGFGVWHHLARDKETLAKRIEKISHCRAAIVELPDDDKGPWHKAFAEQCDNKVDTVYKTFAEVGGFQNRKLIYQDPTYHNRKTYLLTK